MSAPMVCQGLKSRLLGNTLKFSFARITAAKQKACNERLRVRNIQRLNLSSVVRSSAVGLEQQISQRLQPCRQYCSEVTTVQEQEIREKDKADELDVLYQRVFVEVKGHDFQVMQSYRKFVLQTAKELDVSLAGFKVPKKYIEKKSLLRSVFIYKKHWTQYEMRTHYMIFEFKHLTGSTADTMLEYIQRNLPEGMAMKTTKHRLEKFPEDLQAFKAEKLHSAS